LLWEKEINQVDLKNGTHSLLNFPLLFVTPPGCFLGYDIFSAVFYMVSRFEEYLPFSPDEFGRFPEKISSSGILGFTQLPIVHLWAKDFSTKFQRLHANIPVVRATPKALFSYDIDVAYAYRGRSIFTHIASLAKNVIQGQFEVIKNKRRHRFGKRSDPSDTYDLIDTNPHPVIYFMLLSNKRTRYDRNLNPGNPALQALIKVCGEHGDIGIHPSYYSMEQTKLIEDEKSRLQAISGKKISQSRQHFLRFRLPDTYRALIKAGITDDYSMQYPEMPGFRAGICVSYPFFDILADSITQLTIHPGCIMETTFRDDLHLPASDSWQWYARLWKEVSESGGTFISIWHNDTMWKGLADSHPLAFRQIHQKMVHLISTTTTPSVKPDIV
jgi:hypothetical protein